MIVVPSDPGHPDALALIETLSLVLREITGDSGESSFDVRDVSCARALFVIARDKDVPVGCGAIRPIADDTAELKRMYAEAGCGAEILHYLENAARDFGFSRIVLSTRIVNRRAVGFYARHGYQRIANFGKYAGRSESVCMEKWLAGCQI
ncbi:GNAT family N-acetyltransferase [Martelella sp. HB161492]|uniref:GNAT family N-acetyltransferase n=1 Tax=Martelella sp. HB161492 TaxID=2720726 RepID=UPI0015906262|nr:GNAT family N-acetyltransferase [Martelella sp. HB161492]